MIEFLLRAYLVYLSFVQPVIYGAQLCHSPHPDALQVTNVALTLLFGWLLEVADVLFLSSFIAMRWLYLCARIILALYVAHPRFLGAVRLYQKLFSRLVDAYSPVIDSMLMCHVQTLADSGFIQYGTQLIAGLLRGIAGIAAIAKTLMEASTTTVVPAAPLPRRMSQERNGDERPQKRVSPPPRPTAVGSTSLTPPSLFEDDSSLFETTNSLGATFTLEPASTLDVSGWPRTMHEEVPPTGMTPDQTVSSNSGLTVQRTHRHRNPTDGLEI